MYTEFFALDELPFEGLPDRRFYYVGSAQHKALSLLTQSLSRSGSICVLSGPSGSGKTTMVRMLMRSLPSRMRIVTIDDPRLNANMLLATILRASGVVATSFEDIAELTLKLRQCLEDAMRMGVVTTVICDEAQGLSDEVIEQIRLISNIEGELGKMINFLLVGQEELIKRIKLPQHSMFWGRVRAFAAVPALSREETHAYIAFRLQQAGCSRPLFTAGALRALYHASGGLPRLVNSIADRAMEIACAQRRQHVGTRVVKRAVRVVRSRNSLGKSAALALKRLFLRLTGLAMSLALGAAIAAAGFYAVWHYAPRLPDLPDLPSAAQSDMRVRALTLRLLERVSPGRTRSGRERALFEISRAQSVFAGDSVTTLINLWGLARRDGRAVLCSDLRGSGLECHSAQGSLEELAALRRPAVISLRGEDMTPYAGILWKLEDQKAELILGSRLWEVERSFVEHEYDGSYTMVRGALPARAKDLDKDKAADAARILEERLGKIKLYPGAQPLDEYMKAFRKQYPDPLKAAEVYDSWCPGPRLDGEGSR